jgi:hypothetical protein
MFRVERLVLTFRKEHLITFPPGVPSGTLAPVPIVLVFRAEHLVLMFHVERLLSVERRAQTIRGRPIFAGGCINEYAALKSVIDYSH